MCDLRVYRRAFEDAKHQNLKFYEYSVPALVGYYSQFCVQIQEESVTADMIHNKIPVSKGQTVLTVLRSIQ